MTTPRHLSALGLLALTATAPACLSSPDGKLHAELLAARKDLVAAETAAKASGSARWTPQAITKSARLETPSGSNMTPPEGCTGYTPGDAIALGPTGGPAAKMAVLYSADFGGRFGWLIVDRDGTVSWAPVHNGTAAPGAPQPLQD